MRPRYLSLISPIFTGPSNTPRLLDPATQITINYEISDQDASFEAKALYREKGTRQWMTKVANITTTKITRSRIHHITLSHLKPNHYYEYRVAGSHGKLSKQYHFKTAKIDMDYSRFLIIGDMQDELMEQRWQDIVNAITKSHFDDFDFIITVGDMAKDDISESGERFFWWKVFFDKGQDLFAYKAMMPSIGNHDTPASLEAKSNKDCAANNLDKTNNNFPAYCSNAQDSSSYRKYFNINPDMTYPDYYSFKYGNACFISMNSEIPIYYGRYPELDTKKLVNHQKHWLEQKLNQHRNCSWSFIYHHVPIINTTGNKKHEVVFMRPYADLISNKVDWSISGHIHQYQRLTPLLLSDAGYTVKSSYGRGDDLGTGYLLVPPAGQWPRVDRNSDLRSLTIFPQNALGEMAYEIGFTIIKLDKQRFTLSTYGMGSVGNQVQPEGYRKGNNRTLQLIDSLSYTKSKED
ncbi:MAG: hypothetical protein COA74_14775 [Gammaproteobacteria bacterium]|nr:MAG: hypothetical protein COA74_14775 [Gammaproteobacteria bacterium]